MSISSSPLRRVVALPLVVLSFLFVLSCEDDATSPPPGNGDPTPELAAVPLFPAVADSLVGPRPILRWSLVAPGKDGAVTSRVYCGLDDPPSTLIYSGEDSTCALTGLAAGATYCWRIVVTDAQGNDADAGPWSFSTTPAPLEFVAIPAGTFAMGSPENEPGRVPDEILHWVRLTRDFELAVTEVTQAQFSALMGDNPSTMPGDDLPVDSVTWLDTIEFCNRLSEREGRTPVYEIAGETVNDVTWNRDADGYRLPTESEWEYACRAGTTGPFYTGRCLSADVQANYDGRSPLTGCAEGPYRGGTIAVRSFPANAWGLYDMPGNAYEWCWDLYENPYPAGTEEDPVVDPLGAETGDRRVQRGGSFKHGGRVCRSAMRNNLLWPTGTSPTMGFRVAR